jgi:hypothetical protein
MDRVLALIAAAVLSSAIALPAVAEARSARPDCDAAAREVRGQIEAACPCANADNRGEHTRCVTKKIRELSECQPGETGNRQCGPIPRRCLGAVRRISSRSACGNPDVITCCVPRQQDCVGDKTSGDGNAEGTCGRTSKKCDGLADCKIPRCQLAPNAKRCEAMGGTLGAGKDCSSACPS